MGYNCVIWCHLTWHNITRCHMMYDNILASHDIIWHRDDMTSHDILLGFAAAYFFKSITYICLWKEAKDLQICHVTSCDVTWHQMMSPDVNARDVVNVSFERNMTSHHITWQDWHHITSHDKTCWQVAKIDCQNRNTGKMWHVMAWHLQKPTTQHLPQPTACQRLQVARWPCVTNDGSDCLVVRPGWALQWTNTSEGAPRGYCEGQGRSGVAYGKWKLQKRTAGRKNRCQLSKVSKPLGTLYWSVTVLTKTCQIFWLFLKIEVRLFPYLLCRMISPSTWPYWSD